MQSISLAMVLKILCSVQVRRGATRAGVPRLQRAPPSDSADGGGERLTDAHASPKWAQATQRWASVSCRRREARDFGVPGCVPGSPAETLEPRFFPEESLHPKMQAEIMQKVGEVIAKYAEQVKDVAPKP
ncbi:MAG: hypothetical protein AB7I01_01965 [Gammaproteobacteria bacterium]